MGVAAERARRLKERRSLQVNLFRRRWNWTLRGGCWRWSSKTAVGAAMHFGRCHGVIRRHGKERSRRLRALNVCERIGGLPEAWIAAHNFYRHLQIRGIPLLVDTRDGIGIPDRASRDRARVPSALRADPIDYLHPQILFLNRAVRNFLAEVRLELFLQGVGAVRPFRRSGKLLRDLFIGVQDVSSASHRVMESDHGPRLARSGERPHTGKCGFTASAPLAVAINI